MNDYLKSVARSELFYGIDEVKIDNMILCLAGFEKTYAEDEIIWYEGKNTTNVGIVLYGRVHMENCDFWGNKTIIMELEAGSCFGVDSAFSKEHNHIFDVVAKEETKVLFFDANRLKTPCEKGCFSHKRVIENLLSIVATTASELSIKMNHMCKRTTRDKLLSYLSWEANRQATDTFKIPFNRNELADYLSVERCAMSKELHKMKREGLVEFSGNNFKLRNI